MTGMNTRQRRQHVDPAENSDERAAHATMNDPSRSIRVFYAALSGEFAMFSVGVSLLFFHTFDHLSYTRSVALYAVIMLAATLFDLLGGGIADAYGRKRSYIAGIVLYLAAFGVPVIFVRQFYVLVFLATIGGIGQGLKSNALPAIMADLLEHNQTLYQRVNAHGNAVLFAAKTAAALIGGILYEVSKPLPFAAEAVALAGAAIVAARLPDTTERSRQAARHITAAIHHLRTKARGLLHAAIVATMSAYFAGDLLFAYYQPFFARRGFSAAALGMIFAMVSAGSALSSWGVKFAHHHRLRLSVLAVSTLGVILNGIGVWSGIAAFALSTVFIQALANGVTVPTIQLMAAEQTPRQLRVSVLSATTTITACGMLLGFLLSGFLADHGNNRSVGIIAVSACLAALSLAAFSRRSRTPVELANGTAN